MSIRLEACVLALALGGPALADAALLDGLVACYPFNGNAQDVSGNANHGALGGNVAPTTDRYGNPNSAYLFDGTSSWILVPDSPSLHSPTTPVTQAAWVSLNGVSLVGAGFNPVLMKSATSENGFMYRLTADPQGFAAAYNNWNASYGTPAAIGTGAWHFVAVTYDGAKVRQYLDGVPADSIPVVLTMTTDTRPLMIGYDTPGVLECMNGKIDDVWIFNRALSGPEIAQLYSSNPVGVDGKVRASLALSTPFPSPANGNQAIGFTLPVASTVELDVFDAAGRHVRRIALGTSPAGAHTVSWDGRDARGSRVPPGVYLFRLAAGTECAVRRGIRVR